MVPVDQIIFSFLQTPVYIYVDRTSIEVFTDGGALTLFHVTLRKKRTNGKRISIDLQERITPI